MAETTHPSKEVVRRYLEDRRKAKAPPPTPEQVRRELGWWMLPNNRK